MENLIYFILVAIVAFASTAFSIPQIVRIAIAKNLFDSPNSRRVNIKVVPTLGGIAIFIGFILGTTIAGDGFSFFEIKYIFAALLIIFFAGIKDDLVTISPRTKLVALTASILIIALFANLNFNNFHGFMGINQIPPIPGIILTVFIGIVIINSMNLIDGIDGLASALAIQISSILGIWFALVEQFDYALISFSLAGSCLAFFIFNVFGNRNKIFMGDTGSLILGAIIFILAAKFNQVTAIHTGDFAISSAPAVLIGVLAYPLFDVLRVFVLRVFVIKKSPFKPDKNHIHHRLLAFGMNHLQATTTIFLVNSLIIIGTLVLSTYLNVIQLTVVILSFTILISTLLELVILYSRKINPNDEFQNLFLPRYLVNAVYQKAL